MVFSVDLVRGSPAQALAPDHTAQMGGSGASLTVGAAAVANSSAAPRAGLVLVTIPAGSSGAIRVGLAVVAVATDQIYPGGDVYSFPILAGSRVSIFGDATGFTASVSMAQ